MLVNSATNFRIGKQRYKEEYLSPNNQASLSSSSITSYSQNTYRDIKRPLKTNHSDLAFEGLSLYNKLEKVYSKSEFEKWADTYVGKMGRELLEDITVKHKADTSKLISVEGDKIILAKKSIPHLAWDGIIYPFKILPGDMLNGTVELLGKVPGLKNWSARVLEKPLFKNIRQRSKLDAKVNSLRGLIVYRDSKITSELEKYAKANGISVDKIPADVKANLIKNVDDKMGSSVFQSELKMFDPKSGNYDTKHERALNRLVSGLPPAIFLANDAYNLSRMMDDDPKAASHESKVRFKQETSRILTSGYLTLITMGAFQKFINKSKAGIVLITGLTVLVTEMFSRLSNGKHIVRLTPEEARAENEKLHNPEAKIKPLTFKAEDKKADDVKTPNQAQQKQKEQKPLLSFDTVMKASAAVLAVGYSIKGVKNLPSVKKAALKYFENLKTNNSKLYNELGIDKMFENMGSDLKKMDPKKYENYTVEQLNLENAVSAFESKVLYRPFTDLYKKLTTQKYIVEDNKLALTVQQLKDNGFEKLADKYQKIAETGLKTVDGNKIIDLGEKDRTFKVNLKFLKKEYEINVKPFVNFVIAPFKFLWNTVTLPYWMIDEKLMGVFRKAKPKSGMSDMKALANSFDKISKKAEALRDKTITEEQFKDYIQVNLLKAFNEDSMSSVSNAELSNLAKTAASIATIWFLMTDNYNMVMLKSNGNDKQGADTKFKERFVQEGSRLFYQTLLIDLFNSTFVKQYHSSLMGMSMVTLIDTTLGEMLTRSSVGTPIKPHTRDELIDIETKQNNSTGFKKKYYNFMQRLTGKRSIKSYEVAPRNGVGVNKTPDIPSIASNKQFIFSQGKNDSTLEKMIRS